VIPTVTRPEPPFTGDEHSMLSTWMDYQRSTLLWKCQQLDGEALARRDVPPSPVSLLGIVRHMTIVEWHWFEHIFAGNSAPRPIAVEPESDDDWNDLDPSRAMEDIKEFERECEVTRGIVAGASNLDEVAANAQDTISLRWIMVHMIEEYARHNGHADLLRERIDGAVGE
jgi:uncharacterized damage-inducible protein DinB